MNKFYKLTIEAKSLEQAEEIKKEIEKNILNVGEITITEVEETNDDVASGPQIHQD